MSKLQQAGSSQSSGQSSPFWSRINADLDTFLVDEAISAVLKARHSADYSPTRSPALRRNGQGIRPTSQELGGATSVSRRRSSPLSQQPALPRCQQDRSQDLPLDILPRTRSLGGSAPSQVGIC